jgi:hypothetical protein
MGAFLHQVFEMLAMLPEFFFCPFAAGNVLYPGNRADILPVLVGQRRCFQERIYAIAVFADNSNSCCSLIP